MANRAYNLTRADMPNAYITNGYLDNAIINAELRIAETSAPSAVTDYGLIYVMTDGNAYFVNESGERFKLNVVDSAGEILTLTERSSTPSQVADNGLIYVKTDDNLYYLDDSGNEYQLNAAGYTTQDYFSIGGEPVGPYPTLRRCTIDSTGDIELLTGPDLMLNSTLDDSPDQEFIAERIWNSVWNDIADFQSLANGEEFEPGKCYFDTPKGAMICNENCQKSVIGIASNTFGFGVGAGQGRTVPIAVAGWTLAYVDKEYESGTPLTNTDYGDLTEMKREEVKEYPERLVAIYKKKEPKGLWGTKGKEIDVNERHWVKVK